jgi:hypothetical protein
MQYVCLPENAVTHLTGRNSPQSVPRISKRGVKATKLFDFNTTQVEGLDTTIEMQLRHIDLFSLSSLVSEAVNGWFKPLASERSCSTQFHIPTECDTQNCVVEELFSQSSLANQTMPIRQ